METEALGLAQLQRRIKDEAQKKAKLRQREREAAHGGRARREAFFGGAAGSDGRVSSPGVDLQLHFNPGETLRARPPPVGGREGDGPDRGGVRRRYQDLVEAQQQAAVLLDEYHARRLARLEMRLVCGPSLTSRHTNPPFPPTRCIVSSLTEKSDDLLHGELRKGGSLEYGVDEDDEDKVKTNAAAPTRTHLAPSPGPLPHPRPSPWAAPSPTHPSP